MNLLLIDSTIQSLDKFLDGINENTKVITYKISDTFESLNEKIANFNIESYENIGIVFVDDHSPLKMFVSYNTFITFNNTGMTDNNTTRFIKEIVEKYSVKNLDFLACNLLSYPEWKNYFNYLIKDNNNLTVRASSDRTGNLNTGGDWILESNNEDVSNLYFNENIKNWNYLLDRLTNFTTILQGINNNLIGVGGNIFGELNNQFTSQPDFFIKSKTNITNILNIVCGFGFTMLLKEDGTIWGCGDNYYGQLGNGESGIGVNKSVFTQCAGNITNAIKIACGYNHTMIIRDDGINKTVWGCGYNNKGQLGDDTVFNKTTFTQCNGSITNGNDISCGAGYTILLKDDKTIWGCGDNYFGQLGINEYAIGINRNKLIFTQCYGNINDVSKIACGDNHTMIIRDDGINKTIWGCGSNYSGQLGNGESGIGTIIFTQCIGSINNATDVSCGNSHTIIKKSDDTIWSCGFNYFGQLGINLNGDGADKSVFTQCEITNVFKIVCGNFHTMIIKNNGTVWGCGFNDEGQLGIGISGNNKSVFTECIGNINNAINIACGGNSTLIIRNEQTMQSIWGCGSNIYNQLCNEFVLSNPVSLTNFDNNTILTIACGGLHTMIIKKDKTVWGCGNNSYGQLGIGNTNHKYEFTQCIGDINNAINVVCGNYFTIIIREDGSILGCGLNSYGQLGNGTIIDKLIFTECLGGINNVKKIACGQIHTMIIREDGTVWGCGDNNYGQLGIGISGYETNKLIFTQCNGNINNAIEISCGSVHTMIIRDDHTVWGCGSNYWGQLGIGNNEDKSAFIECIGNINNAISISGGSSHTILLKNDGTLLTCGRNNKGQLGIGNNEDKSSFTQCIVNINNIVSIICGYEHTLIINNNGGVMSCGSNYFNHLGDGTNQNKNIFVETLFTKTKFSENPIKNISNLSSFVTIDTENTYAYLPDMISKIVSSNDISENDSDIKNILTTTNKKIIELTPKNTVFSDYVSFSYNFNKDINGLKVYFKSESDNNPYLIKENIDEGYGAYYIYNSSIRRLTIYTKHFSEVGFGYEFGNLVCLLYDTEILTPKGYIQINKLNIGDKVITSNLKIFKIKDIKKYSVKKNAKSSPYIIPKNYFGNNCPNKDTRISRLHNILLNDKWLSPEKNSHIFEQDLSIKEIIYYHIELDDYKTDHLVINGGLIAESYGRLTQDNLLEAKKRLENSIIIKKRINKNPLFKI